jgi:glycosyltransferase involved in cell wall biosynthesis
LKIAIIHDWLVINAGAERVLKAILEIYPDSDIFSLVEFLNDEDKKTIINDKFVTTSFIQKLPLAKKYFRYYLPLFPKAIESFDLSSYDLVISSSWAVAKGVKTSEEQLHISYFQARNMKYIWDEEDLYTTGLKKIFKILFFPYLRRFDILSSKRPNYIITNSLFVKKWVKKRYKRDSIIIHPPVNINSFTLNSDKEDFYLTASRLVPYKKVKLIVEAFNKMPNKKLVLIGDGEEFSTIKKIAKDNIEMLGYKNTEELVPYMQKAKAFVYAAVEDFGIVPIEAMACGTPVIALNDGGTAETVIDKVNGIHFKEQTTDDIIDAVNKFESLKFIAKSISQEAQIFSTERFKKEISEFIADLRP